MGQRHQVYLRLRKIDYGDKNPNNKPETTIGIHHQWLYGQTALRLLNNLMTFWEQTKDDMYPPLHDWYIGDARGILSAIGSVTNSYYL